VRHARRRGGHRLSILADPHAAGFYETMGAELIGRRPSDAVSGRYLPLYRYLLAPKFPEPMRRR
jgi:hypothetical protein